MTVSEPQSMLLLLLLVMLATLFLPGANAWLFGRRRSSSSYRAPPPPPPPRTTTTTTTTTTATTTTTTSLPDSCYSPNGIDCSWYQNCLEKRYPCTGETNGTFDIAMERKYCALSQQNYNNFSSKGKSWADAVRKCLQENLVVILKQDPPQDCIYIRSVGMYAHVPRCFGKPSESAPSLCDLNSYDKSIMVRTFKASFLAPGHYKYLMDMITEEKICVQTNCTCRKLWE